MLLLPHDYASFQFEIALYGMLLAVRDTLMSIRSASVRLSEYAYRGKVYSQPVRGARKQSPHQEEDLVNYATLF